jgi:predicted Zn-dependent protease
MARTGLTCLMMLFMVQARPVQAHGDLHLQIVEVSEIIQKDPSNPDLYLKRGELNRIHQLWDAALADFETVRSLSPTQVQTDLRLGRLYLDMDLPAAADSTLSRFLEKQTVSPEAYTLRGQARVRLDRPLEGAQDFGRAIQHHLSPGPELYIQQSLALSKAGSNHLAEAVASLDAGINKLGSLVTLQLPAIDLEIEQEHYDDALRRLDQLTALSPRKETWLKRRGEILLKAGRDQEALEAFENALEAMEKLPPARRFVPAMQALETKLGELIDQINTQP